MSFSIYETTAQWAREKNFALSAEVLTASTSDSAKAEALSVREDFKLYLADEQSAGRGRGKNTWINPARGSSLLTTWSFKVASAPQAVSWPLVGLAVYEALQKTFASPHLSIKAPNDIYFRERKILGILLETVKQGSEQRLLIGLGLNVFAGPDGLDTAGFLASECNVDLASWRRFLDTLFGCLRAVAFSTGQAVLSEKARGDLLTALNRYPHLGSPFTSVSPFGDLATAEHTRSWQDI